MKPVGTCVNFPVLWTSEYCLIRVISFWSCLISCCTLEWWIKYSRCRKRNLLAVNSGTNCCFIFSIVSFRLNIVPMISLIFIMFSLIKCLDIFTTDTMSFSISSWSIWFLYNSLTCCFKRSVSFWSAVPKRKLNRPPDGKSWFFLPFGRDPLTPLRKFFLTSTRYQEDEKSLFDPHTLKYALALARKLSPSAVKSLTMNKTYRIPWQIKCKMYMFKDIPHPIEIK